MPGFISKNVLKVLGTGITRFGRHARLSILIYHRVLPAADPMLGDEVDLSMFRTHMDTLVDGFNVLPLSEAIQRLADGSLPRRAACVTFDDGYANNATVALPVLQERSIPACFFIATEFLDGGCMWNDIIIEALRNSKATRLDLNRASLGVHSIKDRNARLLVLKKLLPELKRRHPDSRTAAVEHFLDECGVDRPTGMMMSPKQVKVLANSGMEIGGHTVSHPILSTLTDQQARTEIGDGKERLESITGQPVRLFAYPNGRPGKDFSERDIAILKDLNFVGAVTTARGTAGRRSDPFRLPRFTPWDRTPIRFTLRLYQNVLQDLNVAT